MATALKDADAFDIPDDAQEFDLSLPIQRQIFVAARRTLSRAAAAQLCRRFMHQDLTQRVGVVPEEDVGKTFRLLPDQYRKAALNYRQMNKKEVLDHALAQAGSNAGNLWRAAYEYLEGRQITPLTSYAVAAINKVLPAQPAEAAPPVPAMPA